MMNQKKTILVTGAAGYVGTALVKELLEHKYSIIAFDKFYFGEKPLIPFKENLQLVKGDIREFPTKILSGVDTLIHLAGLSNDPTAEYNPQANFEINTKATVELAKKAKKAGVKRFIFASSCSIYDMGMEKENGMKDENSYVEPVMPYSSSKHAAELELLKLADQNFCVTILRKGTVYGYSPRMRYDLVVNTMVKNALSTRQIKIFCQGKQWRPLVDLKDVVVAYRLAIEADAQKVNKQIINITGDNYLVKDLASIVKDALEKNFGINLQLLFENEDKRDRSYRVSNLKAKKLLQFSPKSDMRSAVIELVKDIKANNIEDFENPIYYNISWMMPIFEKEQQK